MTSPYSPSTPQLIKGRNSQPSNLEAPKDIDEYKKHLSFLKKEYLKLKNEYEKVLVVSKSQEDEIVDLKLQVNSLQTDTRNEQLLGELDMERELSTMYFGFDPNRFKSNKLYKSRVFSEEEERMWRQQEVELNDIEVEIDKWLQSYNNGNRKSVK